MEHVDARIASMAEVTDVYDAVARVYAMKYRASNRAAEVIAHQAVRTPEDSTGIDNSQDVNNGIGRFLPAKYRRQLSRRRDEIRVR